MLDAKIALLRDNCERLLAQLDEARSSLSAQEQGNEWRVPVAICQLADSLVANPLEKAQESAHRLGERYAENQRPVEELIAQLLQVSQTGGRRASQRQQEQQVGLLAAGIQSYLQQVTRQLTEQAQRDSLTQLWNRAVFDQRFREELSRAERYQREFVLVLFDLDHFKVVNDQYGHPAGDELLQRFAGFLRSSLRQTDSAFRYGGDEFTALLPETGSVAARQVLERLAQRWREINQWGGTQATVEFSYGIAAYPKEAITTMKLLQLADSRLYEHKHKASERLFNQHRSEIQQ